MDDHWKFRRGGGVHFQRVLSEVPISNLLGGGGHERPPGMENLGRGGAHQRVFCGGWGGGLWIFSGSTYFKSHQKQYFSSVSKDHGKPSVTIFWFRENPWKPTSYMFSIFSSHIFFLGTGSHKPVKCYAL